jgi:hypothetical protein
MDHLIICVEQLDRAIEEMVEGSPVSGRLSLILVDNVVELLLHNRCLDVFRREARLDPDPARPGRYSRAARRRVLGQHFDEKYKFLHGEGDINQQELEFIRICHNLRGEAYHTGVTHDQFIRALASEYFSLCCRLLGRLQPTWRTTSSRDRYGSRISKHLRPGTGGLENRFLSTPVEDIVASLETKRPVVQPTLSAALSDSISARIESLEENLNFLVENAPSGCGSLEKELVAAQRWTDLFAGIPVEIEERTAEYSEYVRRRQKEMTATWRPQFRSLPLLSWRRRAKGIRRAGAFSALQRYEQLSADISYIEDVLESSASALGTHIDSQVDAALEERARGRKDALTGPQGA